MAHILGFDKRVSLDTVVSQPLLIFIMQNPPGNGLSQGNGKPLKDKKKYIYLYFPEETNL